MSGCKSICHLFTCSSATPLYQCLSRNNRRPPTRTLTWKIPHASATGAAKHVEQRSHTHPAGNVVLAGWSTSPFCTRGAKLSGYKISEPMDWRGSPVAWPQRSTDRSCLDFFWWGQLKSLVYETPLNLLKNSSLDVRPLQGK
ncbi:hypothetical protein AVEN_264877-1 [Araneus ventricosus]|uniref:Uncharacterized protein n=1 Tax=Araneus ventricosus TaxID=182803 RepID=A0A4Y2X4L4_ARAVE|nr:hypothetical protein AVEN_264877-1 [Araneus ventricosus]